MKYVIAALIFQILHLNIYSQEVKALGKIVYEERTGENIHYIEMWFSSSCYMYKRKNDFSNFSLTEKNYEKILDSLSKGGVSSAAVKKQLKGLQPDQVWYGKLGDSIVIDSTYLEDYDIIKSDTLSFVKWTVLEDTTRVNNLLCQKATGVSSKGSVLEAWFAPSIPTSVAPYTLRGLPGLIINVNYINKENKGGLKMLELYWPLDANVIIKPPAKSSVLTRTEAEQKIYKHNAEVWELIEYYKKLEKEKKKQ